MNSSDLVLILAEAAGLTKADAKKGVDALFGAIAEAAARGDEIAINNFGKFTTKKTPERPGFNPVTRDPITIKAATRISFKAGKVLKDRLNG